MNHTRSLKILAVIIVLFVIFAASIMLLPKNQKKTVVVYTSVDQVYSEAVFRAFENQTGIQVLAVYDVEATKTTGLVNRLIAEKNRPQADVFWSGEVGQTLLLKNESILAPYISPSASDIPQQYKDPEGYWTGFGGRARIFIVNTDRLTPDMYPKSVYDMLDHRYEGSSIGIAYPMFGTTSTHAAAIYSYLGREQARTFFGSMTKRGVRVVDGNSVVRDLVVNGQLAYGLTDTDDACSAVQNGEHVTIIIPDQREGEMGTLVIPNTVALVAGSSHPADATKFIDYLLDKQTEEAMVKSGWIQIPVRNVSAVTSCVKTTGIRTIPVTYQDVYTGLQTTQKDLIEIFIR